jgi:predicted aspartyl protease
MRVGAIIALAVIAQAPLFAAVAEPSSPEPSPAAVLADLPFLESEEANRIYVDLAPPGHRRPLRLLLDTGANITIVTPGAAKAMGIRVRRLKRDPYRRATVLGRDLQLYIDTSSSETASRTGWEYGLLGGEFLARYVVELDFAGRRVRFLDPRKYQVPESVDAPGEAVLPMEVVSHRPAITIQVNEQSIQLLLDTGAPMGLMLSGELARASSVPSRPTPGFAMAGVMGDVESELGEVASLRLGPFEFTEFPVAVAPRGWFNLGYPGDSILGYDVLAQFTVRLDYPNRRLWLRRNPDARMTFLGADYGAYRDAGTMLLRQEGGYAVGFVRADSPAARLGLRPGDMVETRLTPAELSAAIRSGEVFTVAREQNGVRVDVALGPLAPEPAPPAVAAPPPEE